MQNEKSLTHRVKHVSKQKTCTLCGSETTDAQFKGHKICFRCLEFVKANF